MVWACVAKRRRWLCEEMYVTHSISYSINFFTQSVPSVLWRCWLGGRKGIQPVKNWVVGCWRGCLGWGADLHIAQQMPLPLTISCSSKSRLVLTFLVLPFWYLLTWVVPDFFHKISKTVVCVSVCVFFTQSHLSWSSIILYLLSPSTMIHGILPVQFTCLPVYVIRKDQFTISHENKFNTHTEISQHCQCMTVDKLRRNGSHQKHTAISTIQYHTYTHNRFTALLEYVRDHPGEQVPER